MTTDIKARALATVQKAWEGSYGHIFGAHLDAEVRALTAENPAPMFLVETNSVIRDLQAKLSGCEKAWCDEIQNRDALILALKVATTDRDDWKKRHENAQVYLAETTRERDALRIELRAERVKLAESRGIIASVDCCARRDAATDRAEAAERTLATIRGLVGT